MAAAGEAWWPWPPAARAARSPVVAEKAVVAALRDLEVLAAPAVRGFGHGVWGWVRLCFGVWCRVCSIYLHRKRS